MRPEIVPSSFNACNPARAWGEIGDSVMPWPSRFRCPNRSVAITLAQSPATAAAAVPDSRAVSATIASKYAALSRSATSTAASSPGTRYSFWNRRFFASGNSGSVARIPSTYACVSTSGNRSGSGK